MSSKNVTEIIDKVKYFLEQASNAGSDVDPTILQTVKDQKTTVSGAAYGDLQDSTNAVHALLYYGARNNDLSGAIADLNTSVTTNVNKLVADEDLAHRQNDINQWTANNKLDTLFVYQQLLIILCATVILVYLMKRGLISSTVLYIIVTVLALIFIFTIVNRAQYTYKLRDTRYWNKRSFEQSAKVPAPQICGV